MAEAARLAEEERRHETQCEEMREMRMRLTLLGEQVWHMEQRERAAAARSWLPWRRGVSTPSAPSQGLR